MTQNISHPQQKFPSKKDLAAKYKNSCLYLPTFTSLGIYLLNLSLNVIHINEGELKWILDPALGGEGRGRDIMKMRPIHSFVPIQAGSLFISSSSSNGFFQKSAKKGRLFLIENEASEKTQLYNQDFR